MSLFPACSLLIQGSFDVEDIISWGNRQTLRKMSVEVHCFPNSEFLRYTMKNATMYVTTSVKSYRHAHCLLAEVYRAPPPARAQVKNVM